MTTNKWSFGRFGLLLILNTLPLMSTSSSHINVIRHFSQCPPSSAETNSTPICEQVFTNGRTATICTKGIPNSGVISVNGVGNGELSSKNSSSTVLILCEWPQSEFYPNDMFNLLLNYESNVTLNELTLIGGHVESIPEPFPSQLEDLEILRLIRIPTLKYLNLTIFQSLTSLKELDLRHNTLTTLDFSPLEYLPALKRIFLQGNRWDCLSPDLNWILSDSNSSLTAMVVDPERLVCTAPYKDKPLVPVLKTIKRMHEECPTPCECTLSTIVWKGGIARLVNDYDEDNEEEENNNQGVNKNTERKVKKKRPYLGDLLEPYVAVNCTHRGLKAFPIPLPYHTKTLLCDDNNITDLSLLINGHHGYRDLLDLQLDGNGLSSLASLESSSWLSRFRRLSLNRNRLETLPTYAFDNALQRNGNVVAINLGSNPWRCDCHFTPYFQELLAKYMSIVKDIPNIRCAYHQGDENSLKTVTSLSRSVVCREGSPPLIEPLDLLNIILALLIVLVLGKLCYDYWTFKRTGKLPWIVAKMP